jgi:predicted exporter
LTILSSISDRLLRALGRRRGVVLCASLLLAGLMGWAASRLDMGQDVTELLPSLAEEDREALDVLSDSAFMDRLYLELEGPDPEALARAGNDLADRLENDERIVAVESRVTAEQERRAASVVFEHRFHLLRPGASAVAGRLTRDGVRRQLEIDRARLLGPVAGLSVQVARDPLGLAEIVRSDLAGAMGSERFRMYRGLAFTPDLTRCLLVLRTRVRSLAVDDAGLLVDDVRTMADGDAPAGITARVTGPHVFSSQSARAVKSDVLRAFGLAIAGIVLLFLLYFRRPGFLLAGLLPSAAGVLAGFAISSIALERISGIAVGFGSIIVGISVDYSIHYLRERLGEADPAAALRRILPSLLAGFATTAVVFAFYGISDFPLIRELGLFAGSGVLFGFLAAVLILPLLPARRGEVKASVRMPARILHPTRRAALVVLVVCAAAVAALGAFLPRLDLEDDIRKLDYRDPGTARFAEELEERWLGEQEGRVIIARGTTVQDALEVNDVVGLAGTRGVPMTSLAPVLPSIATQRRNVEEFARLASGLRQTIEAEADDLGFTEGMFDPFFDDVQAALDGTTAPLTVHDLEGTPMSHLAASSIVRHRDGAAVLSFVPGGVPVSFAHGLDATVTSRVEIMNRVFESVRSEVLRLVVLSLLGIALVLLLRYRRIRPALVAMVPVVAACVITAGVFALAGKPVNAIAALAFTLILGVGLDYGIFMVDALERGPGSDRTAGAVLVSGLTTLVSFGVLWTCRNPVLESTGLVVLTGVVASLAAALLVVPAIHALATRGRTA